MATRDGVYTMDADGENLTLLTSRAPHSVAWNSFSWLRPACRAA